MLKSEPKIKSRMTDMTEGPVLRHILLFAVPLMLGNLFQMLYNTVDSVIVGNFVGKQALAAIGSTTMIVNMLVFFFNGFSAGAGVIISHRFGAKETDSLHTAVETSMAATFILSIVMTVFGVANVRPMLRLMATPDDVFAEAASYLTIYIAGISGLLIYNMGSGILRAVGDSRRPLLFIGLTAVVKISLDLLFAGVTSVGLTFLISLCILAPVKGFVLIFTGSRFFLHGVCPVVAMIAFCFFISNHVISLRESVFALIPVMLYAMVYYFMVEILGPDNGCWDDFYGFLTRIPSWISLISFMPLTFGIASVLRVLHNRTSRKLSPEQTEIV